ncbi:LAMI_0D12398g1_1 [Lachancea mirantina]|uniref:LAMI_0D12398g1_1 n=1 Tax=Lachancea mirantina TaxID=1230905 RepID=A0A1G4JFP2_9SACH|nr:LAMI_0D12398g1_1 [Lachancea mirantina]
MSDGDIQQFMALTNASVDVAQQYLQEFGALGEALDAFYASRGDGEETGQGQESSAGSSRDIRSAEGASAGEQVPPVLGAPSGRAGTPQGARTPQGTRTPQGNSRFKSFSDLLRDNSDEDDEQRNTFAGGETSGLEVSDPNDSNSLIRDLLEKARKGGQQGSSPEPDASAADSNHFTGRGYRLGSTLAAPTQVAEDIPEEPLPSRPKKVTRNITFWKEGFQVGDGELRRYDDPANGYYLSELNQGRAPLRLLDVEFGQEVDVNVFKKLDESFKAPKRKLGGFLGEGQRLGSPIPGESIPTELEASLESVQHTEPANELASETSSQPEPQGDTSVQISYANGTREKLRCNSSDTIRFLYDHVKGKTASGRSFTLNHAFPVKPIEKLDSTLKDEDLLNAVVVQRWVV